MGSVRRIGFWISVLALFGVLLVAPGVLMRVAMTPYFFSDVAQIPPASAALILGASIIRGAPSPILAARAEAGKDLYEYGKVPVLLLSGAVEPNYNEVAAMRQYLVDAGIPERDIALDEAGVDTFSSMYRAHNVLLADSLIIVTQDFHLPRAVFLARAMHIKAYGLAASRGGTVYDYLREIPASWKALWDVLVHRVPPEAPNLAPLMISGIAAR
jgi:SanA protein